MKEFIRIEPADIQVGKTFSTPVFFDDGKKKTPSLSYGARATTVRATGRVRSPKRRSGAKGQVQPEPVPQKSTKETYKVVLVL